MVANKVRIKTFVLVLVITMLVLTPILFVCCDKPSIHDATAIEIEQSILGIGEHYSQAIVTYLDLNKDACIEDLDDIDGIGRITIKKLKKEWSD